MSNIDGVLILTGTASLADYRTVLQSVTYSSSSDDPSFGNTDNTRHVDWTVTDDSNATNVVATLEHPHQRHQRRAGHQRAGYAHRPADDAAGASAASAPTRSSSPIRTRAGGVEVVTITSTNGGLSAAANAILTASSATSVTLTGTLAQINAYLANENLTVSGTTSTLIGITIDDQGNTDSTVPPDELQASDSITVTFDQPPTVPVDNDGDANTVAEGASAGTEVQITAFSTDPDGPTVAYSITADTSGGGFAIDANGVVTVADPSKINYEQGAHSYTITVTATDNLGVTNSANFLINVTNVNPIVPVDSDAGANAVVEGAAAGTAVGVTAASTDVNGPTVTYSITADTSGGGFAIDANGVVTVTDPSKINYEQGTHSYTITVQASDGPRRHLVERLRHRRHQCESDRTGRQRRGRQHGDGRRGGRHNGRRHRHVHRRQRPDGHLCDHGRFLRRRLRDRCQRRRHGDRSFEDQLRAGHAPVHDYGASLRRPGRHLVERLRHRRHQYEPVGAGGQQCERQHGRRGRGGGHGGGRPDGRRDRRQRPGGHLYDHCRLLWRRLHHRRQRPRYGGRPLEDQLRTGCAPVHDHGAGFRRPGRHVVEQLRHRRHQ